MPKKSETMIVQVERKVWGPDDTYLVIPLGDIQVFWDEGWSEGMKVKIDIKAVGEDVQV